MKKLFIAVLLADLVATVWMLSSGAGERSLRCFFQSVERF